MKRRLLNLLTVLSMLLCAAVVALWVQNPEAPSGNENAGGWKSAYTYRRVAGPGDTVEILLDPAAVGERSERKPVPHAARRGSAALNRRRANRAHN